MTCFICQQTLTTEYQLVAIERDTWRSLYTCPAVCAEQMRRDAAIQKAAVASRVEGPHEQSI